MQRGDLSTDPLRSLLPELAADDTTGCLYVADPSGGEVSVFLDAARLVGVRVPENSDPLGSRLVARGALSAEALQKLTTDGTPTASLAERIVAEQLVEGDVVDAVQRELAVETVDRMLDWTSGAWRFRRRQRPGRPLRDPIPVEVLLEDARRRAETAEVETGIEKADTDEPSRAVGWNRVAADDDVLEYLARASVALNDALGDAKEDDDSGRASALIRSTGAGSPSAPAVDPATAARRERLRTAAAAELAGAHAEAEQARRDHEAQRSAGDHAAVVDLSVRREAARAARELAELSRTSVREASPDSTTTTTASTEDSGEGPSEPVAPEPVASAPAPAGPLPWQTNTNDHLAATALLREMAGESGQAPAQRPAEPEHAAPVERAPAASGLRRPNAPAGSADTAALLRELSSLGGDEAPARSSSSSPATSPQPRPSGAGAHVAANRRRKGLWGRS